MKLFAVELVPVVKFGSALRGVWVVVRDDSLILLVSLFVPVNLHRKRPILGVPSLLSNPGYDSNPAKHLSEVVLARALGVEPFNEDSIRRILQPIEKPSTLRRAFRFAQFFALPRTASLTRLSPRKVAVPALAPPVGVWVEFRFFPLIRPAATRATTEPRSPTAIIPIIPIPVPTVTRSTPVVPIVPSSISISIPVPTVTSSSSSSVVPSTESPSTVVPVVVSSTARSIVVSSAFPAVSHRRRRRRRRSESE